MSKNSLAEFAIMNGPFIRFARINVLGEVAVSLGSEALSKSMQIFLC
jgi:hypothetical protein